MRQHKREITDIVKLEQLIRHAQVCRLAIHDQPCPYMVPMNFGYRGQCLYFHCALEGKKIDLIRKNPHVGFELEAVAEVVANPGQACSWSAKFQSVVGAGMATIVTDPAEKRQALDIIMAHYAGPIKNWEYPDVHLSKMNVIKLAIEHMTGKQSKEYIE